MVRYTNKHAEHLAYLVPLLGGAGFFVKASGLIDHSDKHSCLGDAL